MSGWLTIKESIIVQNRKLVYRLVSCFNVADLVRYVSRTIFLFTKRIPSFAITHILALAFVDDDFEAPTLKDVTQMGILEVKEP